MADLIQCGMIHTPHPDHEYECQNEAVAEAEGGPVCVECRDACKEEELEVLPLGTEALFSTGKTAFDHASQFDHNSTAHCVIKAVAAMIAYNERTRSP